MRPMHCPICDTLKMGDAIILTESNVSVSVMTDSYMVPAKRWDCVNGHTILVVNRTRLEAATITDGKQTEMHKLFTSVADTQHWKNPINCFVPLLSEDEKAKLSEAVIHFTGSVPEFKDDKRKKSTHVTADGYYRTIGS